MRTTRRTRRTPTTARSSTGFRLTRAYVFIPKFLDTVILRQLGDPNGKGKGKGKGKGEKAILKVRPQLRYFTMWATVLEAYAQIENFEILTDPQPRGPLVRGLAGR